MKQTYPLTTFILSLAAASVLQGQSAYTAGHGDVGLAYEDGDFVPHWHLDGGATVDGAALLSEEEYGSGDLFAETSTTRLSPSGLSLGLGVADGTEIFVLGSSDYLPNLGFAVEELDASDWVGNITLSLSGWSMPTDGDFALYTTNLSDSSVVDIALSTFDSDATPFANSFPLTPGDHVHFQWGFTIAGQYDLEFTWEGTHVVDGDKSVSSVFTVQAVPEPASAVLIMGSVIGILAFNRRRRVG